jgi:hypothetical protein
MRDRRAFVGAEPTDKDEAKFKLLGDVKLIEFLHGATELRSPQLFGCLVSTRKLAWRILSLAGSSDPLFPNLISDLAPPAWRKPNGQP